MSNSGPLPTAKVQPAQGKKQGRFPGPAEDGAGLRQQRYTAGPAPVTAPHPIPSPTATPDMLWARLLWFLLSISRNCNCTAFPPGLGLGLPLFLTLLRERTPFSYEETSSASYPFLPQWKVSFTGPFCSLGCFPGSTSGKEPTCQYRRHRRHRFNS